jgi:Flp pilus assembly protein TadG
MTKPRDRNSKLKLASDPGVLQVASPSTPAARSDRPAAGLPAGVTKQRAAMHRNLGSQSGQSLVELALITPFLLVFLLAVVEMGHYAYISILVGNAARAGAEYGAQSLAQSVNASGIQTAADNDFQNNGQSTSSLTVTSSPVCACDNGGTLTPNPPTTAYCNAAPVGSNSTAGSCTSGHWVVAVSVTASGTFKSLFSWPLFPSSVAGKIVLTSSLKTSSTATVRVKQD